jgi:hypothetical protein
MPRTPLLTLLVGAAALVAMPVSLHFEGNSGTLEPFEYVLPVVGVSAIVGLVAAGRRFAWIALLNGAVGAVAFAYWTWLVTYRGD